MTWRGMMAWNDLVLHHGKRDGLQGHGDTRGSRCPAYYGALEVTRPGCLGLIERRLGICVF
jgi:hypothetical protein